MGTGLGVCLQVEAYMHELRKVLSQNGQYVTGSFSYADIVMAIAVRFAFSPLHQ